MAEDITLTSEEQTEEENKSRKGLLIFWLRMFGWLGAGVAAPITTFAIKFGLFSSTGYEVTTDELGNVTGMNIALNGWGIISVLLIAFAMMSIINEVIDAYCTKYSLAKQCLVGIKKRIIPIAIALGVCYFLRNALDQAIFCLWILGITQIAAIPLNPMPEWNARVKGVENYNDLLTGAAKLIKDYSLKRKEGK